MRCKVINRLLPLLLLLLPLVTSCRHGQTAQVEDALYQRYASRQELNVAQVQGFRLNDSVKIDVVLMVADDEASWQQLKEEFDIRGNEGSVSWLGDPGDPEERVAWKGEPVLRVVASHDRHAIGFYRLENEEQYDALIDYQLGELQTENQ